MTGLALPKHVYARREAEKAKAAQPAPIPSALASTITGLRIYDLDTPVPHGVPVPHRFLIALMPVDIKARVGSIILPDSAIDAQLWLNGLGKVCAVGPGVYRGRRFAEMDLGPADAPKVGDIVIYNAKSPNRLIVSGKTLIYVADDAISATVDPDLAHLVQF